MQGAQDRTGPSKRDGLKPAWLGLGVAASWLLFMALAHTAAHWIVGPAPLPLDPARFVWTAVVNAALLGLAIGGHAHLKAGVRTDLEDLRPLLPRRGPDLEQRVERIQEPAPSIRWLAIGLGLGGGLAVAILDPNLRPLHADLGPGDPRYVAFLLQNLLFGASLARLFAAELHMTRDYARLGEEVEIDLFDTSPLLVFARKGLRSVVVWVLIFTAISMFWVLDSAGQSNVLFPVAVLILVAATLIGPTRGAHLNIAASKAAELARVRDAIRVERDRALAPRSAQGNNQGNAQDNAQDNTETRPEDARLGNLVQYSDFVRSIREWPFDLSIVARSILLILLGAGSWIGGALVERLLERVIG